MNSLGDPSRDNSGLLEQALYQTLCRLLDIKTKHHQTLPNKAGAVARGESRTPGVGWPTLV